MTDEERERDAAEKREWHAAQVRAYQAIEPRYRMLATAVEAALRRGVAECVPLAMVQARVKSVASFAEKAVRKYPDLANPVNELFDLCGGRVITHTVPEVERLCAWVEAHFGLSPADRENVQERLGTSEFGYSCVHYRIAVRPSSPFVRRLPAKTRRAVDGLKLEIQVRTFLQHVWGDVAHDRLYKPGFEVPPRWHRLAARLAAMLEEGDRAFAELAQGVDAYRDHHGVWVDRKRAETELETLAHVTEALPRDEGAALKLAQAAAAVGAWKQVIDALGAFVSSRNGRVHRELGRARLRLAPASDSAALAAARQSLARAIESDPSDDEALALVAESWAGVDAARERSHRARAFERAPTNPYHLCALLSCEVESHAGGAVTALASARPLIRQAIERCRDRADAHLDWPLAFYAAGRLQLFAGAPDEALKSYCKALEVTRRDWRGEGARLLRQEASELLRLSGARFAICGLDEVAALLDLGRRVEEARSRESQDDAFGNVLILAGDTSRGWGRRRADVDRRLRAALRDFRGTIVSGGTRTGICELAARIGARSRGRIRTIGYVPARLPRGAVLDLRYSEIRRTPGARDFSVREVLRYWNDLLTSGVAAPDVKLVGVGGGDLSALEYRIAAALDARVALVADSGDAAEGMLEDRDWSDVANVMPVPDDEATFDALLSDAKTALDDAALEVGGRHVHDAYRASRLTGLGGQDRSLLLWSQLDEGLKRSNRAQVAFIERAISAEGYRVERGGPMDQPIRFELSELERLAEREHGRWNAERLLQGWKPAEERDVARKESPYLVPWDRVPERIKEQDRQAVANWPAVLLAMGYTIRRRRGR